MKPALKLDVLICHPSYGGNGGISSEHPNIREWAVETILKMKADPRIGNIYTETKADTPITAVRNSFVKLAQQLGVHLLLMVDSDQNPQRHAGEPWYKPFWDVAFDEIYQHYQAGPLVIGAPYCGPPPVENVYVFQFEANMTGLGDESVVRLEQYTRSQAATMTGIQECAALPTGMILFDMRIFDLVRPSCLPRRKVLEALQAGQITLAQAEHMLIEGWFYYEWKDGFAAEKASTEDVSSTRDMGMIASQKLGYNPLRCAWDSWIGHHKPWCCGKPGRYTVENIGSTFRAALDNQASAYDRTVAFRSSVLDDPRYAGQLAALQGNGRST